MFDPLMGVNGTSCQLCNLPVQHDHYVLAPSIGMLKIYRARGHHDFEPDEPVVKFGPEHAWLCDAVAMTFGVPPRVVSGPVEDGSMELPDGTTEFVGFGDAFVFHRYCYELIGSPTTHDGLVTAMHTHLWSQIDSYSGQLFEMHEFIEHGHGWALCDPLYNERSRARIDAVLAQARATRPVRGRFTSIEQARASDRTWSAITQRLDHDRAYAPTDFIRYREGLHPELDCADYPTLVWAIKAYEGDGIPDGATIDELERFEVALKAAVEADRSAIMVMSTMGGGQAQYLAFTNDEAATCATIEGLAQGERSERVTFENVTESAWDLYFEKMAPRRY